MPLSPGDKLGQYEIVSLLGKGGMGEVYRARDPKLNREVAIKVLPATLANDADYLARFQREAQTLASLNHPNIAAIYGLEVDSIVMELVEGDTLRGPLSLSEALPLAKQIAEALEAAHEKGIIHRDLKPGNIKVTPEGIVKVLDFGLAKAIERSSTSGADSPTLTIRATEAGLILGTAGYMSPEQAAGKPVDRRADIWSFGVVLYELLTGKRLFSGETVSHTLAHVLTANLDLEEIPSGPIRELLRRCLDRNLKNRLAHITEARIAIENAASAPATTPSQTAAKPSRWPWAVAAVLLLALSAVTWLHFAQPTQEARLISTTILPPEDAAFDFSRPHAMPALSPDGTRIVFGAKGKDNRVQLWIRRLDSSAAQLLPGTEGAATPFWSPDSRWVAFGQDRKLRKIDTQGGPAITIADIPSALRGGSWNRAGVIVIGLLEASPILRVSASGGTPIPVTEGSVDTRTGRHPWFLPDERHFLYQSVREIAIGSIDEPGKDGKRFPKIDSPAVYAQGNLLYLRDTTLMAQPFDPARLEITGEALPVAEGVPYFTFGSRIPGFTVSQAGLLAYQPGQSLQQTQLVWKDRTGKVLGPLGPPADGIHGISLSPDGKHVAVAVREQKSHSQDIWIYETARGVSTRLTFDQAPKWQTAWSPDGKWIYFTSSPSQQTSTIFRKDANGVGTEELIVAGTLGGVSPDGKLLLFRSVRSGPGKGSRLSTLPLAQSVGAAKPEPRVFLESQFDYSQPQFSPDGKWVLYHSNESGIDQIYVAPFPGPGGKRQISRNASGYPKWSQNGKEIFFLDMMSSQMVAVDVAVRNGVLEIGQEKKLLDGRMLLTFQTGMTFDATADGQKLVVVEGGTSHLTAPMTLLQNWTAVLKK